jgi:hypothetical protein
LSRAYSEDASSVLRGMSLMPEGVLIQDEIIWPPGTNEHEVRWQMTTDAEISIHAGTAMLCKDGRTLHARIVSPPEAIFQTAPAIAGHLDRPNPGFRQLIVEVVDSAAKACVAVLLSFTQPKINITPLSSW